MKKRLAFTTFENVSRVVRDLNICIVSVHKISPTLSPIQDLCIGLGRWYCSMGLATRVALKGGQEFACTSCTVPICLCFHRESPPTLDFSAKSKTLEHPNKETTLQTQPHPKMHKSKATTVCIMPQAV